MKNDDPSNANDDFIELLTKNIDKQQCVKLLLSKYRGREKDLQRINIRPISLRDESALCFVYQYKTRDITKNFTYSEGIRLITELLSSNFKSAHLLTTTDETQFEISKKGKTRLHSKKLKQGQMQEQKKDHNREKKRFVDINRPYLSALGVTDQQQQLIPAMSRKWKQINKFIEIFGQSFEQSHLTKDKAINVVDFGSGKGYLTFAIHDYLRHSLNNKAQVTGVELRENLADLCNKVSSKLKYEDLFFVCGDVKTHAPEQADVMIALHACDTATDYAIHYGIQAQASIIMCSPCCHQQIRPQLVSPTLLQPMLQYGVHLGQQAEMVTDSLRALLLEANGYKTKVFEFVSLEHTNKNKMILAVKDKIENEAHKDLLDKIEAIKSFYGIKDHCLESLLTASAGATER
jgi:hypothetical protein